MTTGWWWLLLLLVVSSQSIDSQSTTEDQTCSDEGGLVSQLQRHVERLHQLCQHHQTDMQRLLAMLANQQQLSERLGNLVSTSNL